MEALLTIAIVVAAVVLFATERLPVELVAMGSLCLLVACGLLAPRDVFAVFSNEAAITVGAMFVFAAALEQNGALRTIEVLVAKVAGKSELGLLAVLLPSVMLLSAFVNSTPIVAMFMPVVMSIAKRHDLRPTKLLIPLSYAAILGGTCTLIGTSTNVVVSGLMVQNGLEPMRLFELSPVGAALAGAGLLYLLTLGRRLLPARDTVGSALGTLPSREYLTEASVLPDTPFVGLPPAAIAAKYPGVAIAEIRRGPTRDLVELEEAKLSPGDRLVLVGDPTAMKHLQDSGAFAVGRDDLTEAPRDQAHVIEAIVAPTSRYLGKTLRASGFREEYGVVVLAIHRHGRKIERRFDDVILSFGDTLLLVGSAAARARLLADRQNFLLFSELEGRRYNRTKALLSQAVLLAFVILAGFDVFPVGILALFGAVALVALGCLTSQEAFAAIQWNIVFLLIGSLGLGLALERTGAATSISSGLASWARDHGPVAILSVVYVLTAIMTAILSNTAAAALVVPIALSLARDTGLEPRPLMMAVAFAASADFATPIGYQTNTLVYATGAYRFADFLKTGLPLHALAFGVTVLVLPLVFPLSR